MKFMINNPEEFMIWLGNEIKTIINSDSDSFSRRKKLVDEAVDFFETLDDKAKEIVQDAFNEFNKTGNLGNYMVRRDIRKESDLAEEIVATLETFVRT